MTRLSEPDRRGWARLDVGLLAVGVLIGLLWTPLHFERAVDWVLDAPVGVWLVWFMISLLYLMMLGTVAISLWLWRRRRRLLRSGTHARAYVVSQSSDGEDLGYSTYVQFDTSEGPVSHLLQLWEQFPEGTGLEVVYDPLHPHKVEVVRRFRSPKARMQAIGWWLPAAVGVVWMAVLIVGELIWG